jgi:hypothetical protein
LPWKSSFIIKASDLGELIGKVGAEKALEGRAIAFENRAEMQERFSTRTHLILIAKSPEASPG